MINVLLIAYACEPHKGSEPGIGWNWAIHLSKYINVKVITRSNNKEVIEDELSNSPISNLEFFYFDIPIISKLKKIIPFGVQLYYLLWEFFVIKKIRKFKSVDLIQRVTFVSTVSTLRLYNVKKPYIMSFCAGGEISPSSIYENYSIQYRILEKIRILYNSAFKYCHITNKLYKKSNLVIAVTDDTKKFVENFGYKGKIVVEPAIGMNASFSNIESKKKNKIIYAGSLIYWKNVEIILKSYKEIKRYDLILDIFGRGKEEKSLRRYIKSEGLINRIFLHGPISQWELFKRFPSYDLAIHASSHDSGSMFILEAIRFGVPVLFLNTGGPKEIFNGLDYPLKVDPNQSYEEIIAEFASKIEWFYNNYEQFMKNFYKYREAIIRKYDWDNKVRRMVNIYKEILNENSPNS